MFFFVLRNKEKLGLLRNTEDGSVVARSGKVFDEKLAEKLDLDLVRPDEAWTDSPAVSRKVDRIVELSDQLVRAADEELERELEKVARGDELPPSAAGAALVRHQLLMLDRHALAARCDGAVHLQDATGGLAALGDQRAPGQDLPHVLHREDAWGRIGAVDQVGAQQHADPLQDHPRQSTCLPAARLAALGLAEVRAVRRGMEPSDSRS